MKRVLATPTVVTWTVVATGILVASLALAMARPGTKEQITEKLHKPRESYRTYRVKGIPATYTKQTTEQLLQLALGLVDESSRLKVHSLAFDPYEPRATASKVATVTFRGVPRELTHDKNQWTFTIRDIHVEDSQKPRNVQITIDSHFEGFTPLNTLHSGEAHKIE
jgi:hypothetical protein